MTEEEWLRSDDSYKLIRFLRQRRSARKTRLAYCAKWRASRATELRLPEASEVETATVELAERYADGLASEAEREQGWEQAHRHVAQSNRPEDLARKVLARIAADCLQDTRDLFDPGYLFRQESNAHLRRDPIGSQFIREVYGPHPFRPIAVNPAWRTSTVTALAAGIYEEKAFERLPILADALQDAGCDADAILDHFRDPAATHVRGCWALDLVLGKE